MLGRMLSEIRYRWRSLRRRGAMDAELAVELRDHLDRETEKHLQAGLPRAEAERLAHASFGAVEGIKDDVRDARGISVLDHLVRDFRLAFRSLRLRKAMSLGVVLVLGLGIGVNTTMFGIVDRLLFRAPPGLDDPATVHRLYRHRIRDGENQVDRNFSFPIYLDLSRDNRAFEKIAAFQTRQLAVGEGDNVQEVPVTVASAGYFDFFRVVPERGRFFTQADDQVPEGAPVVVLGYEFWQLRFGGQDVIGQSLRVDRALRTIVGIAPRGFVGMTDQGVPALYLPITNYAHSVRGARYPANYNWTWLELVARRRPQVSVQAAETELTAGFVQSWRNAAAMDPGWGDPVERRVRGGLSPVQIARGPNAGAESRVATWIGGVALIVLLIACANVANLFLSRAVSRQKEIAIRTAVGASRGQILRQLLTESLLLGVLGGVLGFFFAFVGARAIIAFVTVNIPRLKDFSFDRWTLLFTLGISLLTSLVFGLAPALDASKVNLNEALKEGGRSSSSGAARNKLRNALVVAEVALAVVLVTASGLMLRSFLRLQSTNPGFDPANLVTLEIELPESKYEAGQQQRIFQQQLLERLRAVPGVASVASVDNLPFSGNAFNSSFTVEGRPVPPVSERPRAYYRVISPDYFSTMGIRIARGNPFTDRDTADVQGVAIINDVAAQRFWPGEEPLGKKIKRGRPESRNPWVTIVGIVGSGAQNSLREIAQPEIYTPYAQETSRKFTLVARTSTDSRSLAPAIRQEVWATDRDLPVSNMKLMNELISNSVAQPRFYVILLGVFAGLALVLAAVGVYGVMSYSVMLRTRDIGIRMALGARPIDIFKNVLTRALMRAIIGLAIGLFLAIVSTRVISSMLYGISATDPITLAGTVLVLLVVAVVASYLPARRATKVDPMVTLRYE